MEKLSNHWLRRPSRRHRILNIIILLCVCFPFYIVLSTRFSIKGSLVTVDNSHVISIAKHYDEITAKETNNITSLVDLPTNFNFTHNSHTDIKFTILWYNPAEWITRRNKLFQMASCQYNNCRVTDNKALLKNCSAIIFGITMSNMGIVPPISHIYRNPDQVWVHYSLEAPVYHVYQSDYKTPAWNGALNWSMNHNLDADVFAPYGTFKTKSIVPERDYDNMYKLKTKMALWVVSNCGSMSRRSEYVEALQAAGLQIDIYGACGPFGRYKGDINQLTKQYKFYLSFENSFCKYYVTEKVFERFNDDVISVIRGGANYSQLLPQRTFVDVGMFPKVTELVKYLQELASDKQRYLEILREKDKYLALNEDDFGYPYGMCELCRKLNTFGDQRKVYMDLVQEVKSEGRCINQKDITV